MAIAKIYDGTTQVEIGGGGGGNHDILSATHSDSVAQAVTRGSLIYGNATPKWDELVIGASGRVLRSDGSDVAWAALVEADISDLKDYIVGPASATNNAVIRFDATTGKLAQNSGVLISDSNAITGVTSLTADNVRISGNTIEATSGNLIILDAGGFSNIQIDAGTGGILLLSPVKFFGHLDMNGQVLGDGTRTLLSFVEDGSAVNYFEMENEATGGGPIFRAVGADPNIDLLIASKGTGVVKADGVEVVTLTGTQTLTNKTIKVSDDVQLTFGTGDDAVIEWDTSGANDLLVLGLAVGAAATSGYFAIMEKADIGNANRQPSSTTPQPTLRIYSSDATQANDYADLYYDITGKFVIDVGQGDIEFGGSLKDQLTNGPAVMHETSSSTNPTLIPDKADVTAGVGGTSGEVSLITNNLERLTVSSGGSVTIPTGNLFVSQGDITLGEDKWIGRGSASCRIEFDTTTGTDTIRLLDSQLIMEREGAAATARFRTYSTTASQGTTFQLQRSRGTIASPDAVQNGDVIGSFLGSGFSGTADKFNASVEFKVTGTVSGSTVPISIFFNTGATSRIERMRIHHGGNVAVGTSTTTFGKFAIDNVSAAQPVLYLDQGDVSEEMIEFATTIGVGNAIEAVGAKTLTTTHFIKVTLPGSLTRYIPCGTIA